MVMLGAPSQAISTSASSTWSLPATDLNLTTPTANTVIKSPMLTMTTTTTAFPEIRIQSCNEDLRRFFPDNAPSVKDSYGAMQNL